MKIKFTNQRLRIFSAFVVVYMLFALAWWSYLLYDKVNLIHELKLEIDPHHHEFENAHRRQEFMIVGEGIVFALSLIAGIMLINRAYRKEVAIAKQQKNFILSVTHELKSPLTAIQLILDTFKKRKLKEEQYKSLAEDAILETQRLNKLVEDLLITARISSHFDLQLENFNVNSTISNLIILFSRNHPDFQFNTKFSDEEIIIKGNEPSIHLMISNLIDNAIKYSDKNKTIEILVNDQEKEVMIQVKDFGIGIPDKEKEKIFEQFYRIGDEITRKSKGTGLGLYLVKQLSQKLGITIRLKDNLPQGSIFEILLPKK